MEDGKSLNSKKKGRNLLHEPWCCGSLESGSVSIGVTNLVTLLILFLWVIQIVLELKQFFIAVIVTSLVAFVLFVVNVCLVFGSRSRNKSLVLPWLILYLLVLLGLVVACSIQFHEMGQLKPISIFACVVLSYFYFVVAAFYHELVFEGRRKSRMAKEEEMVEVKKKKTDCLISLEEEEEEGGRGVGDETFTHLAHSRKQKDPFSSPSSFLPQPDEVIQITTTIMDQEDFFQSRPAEQVELTGDVTDGKAEEDLFSGMNEKDLFFPDTPQMEAKSNSVDASPSKAAPAATAASKFNRHPKAGISKSIDTSLQQMSLSLVSPSKSAGEDDGDESQAESVQGLSTMEGGAAGGGAAAEGGDVTLPKTRGISLSHSGLIGIIDSSFTPYKQKNPAKSGLPKMKIFLPKSDDDSSSSSSSHSSSSCDEEEVMITKE